MTDLPEEARKLLANAENDPFAFDRWLQRFGPELVQEFVKLHDDNTKLRTKLSKYQIMEHSEDCCEPHRCIPGACTFLLDEFLELERSLKAAPGLSHSSECNVYMGWGDNDHCDCPTKEVKAALKQLDGEIEA